MCSYCGCESIDAIGRFMAEHVQVINALTALRHAAHSADLEATRRECATVAALLGPHTRGEEVSVFQVLSRQEEFERPVRVLCAEHVTLDGLVERVAEGELDLVDAFIDQLREHIDKEENGLFPAAAIALVGPDWEEVDSMLHEHDHTVAEAHPRGT